jgi:hypothetical protein
LFTFTFEASDVGLTLVVIVAARYGGILAAQTPTALSRAVSSSSR